MSVATGETILVAGSANLDFVVRASHVPAPGETVLGRDLATLPGGKGANQAVACARAGGARTRMLLALGADAFAAPIEASLRGAGVELDILRCGQRATGAAFICLSDDAENAITVAPGANAALRPEHLPDLAGVDTLLLQLETPLDTVADWARAAKAAGVRVAVNAAPARELPAALLAAVDVLIVNEGELVTITGIRGDIAAALVATGVPCVIVTLGERGCCAYVDGAVRLQPGFRVAPVDTTGAGDTFCGVFVASLGRGLPIGEAMRRACAASALACTRMGAQTGIPAHDEIESFLASAAPAPEAAYDALAAYCGLARHSSPSRMAFSP